MDGKVLRPYMVELRRRSVVGARTGMKEREVVAGRERGRGGGNGGDGAVALEVVGRALDRFKPDALMVRWLREVTGRPYNPEFNPRRRRRVRGPGLLRNRWVMYRNHGYTEPESRRMIRVLAEYADTEMGRASGWGAICDGLARFVEDAPETDERRAALKADLLAAHGVAVQRGFSILLVNWMPAGSPSRHAGVLVMARNPGRPKSVRALLLDPHGQSIYPEDYQQRVLAAIRQAMGPAKLSSVAFCVVPPRLAVQYSTEGACMLAALSLIVGIARRFARAAPLPLPPNAPPGGLCEVFYRSVRDRDVVLVAQLTNTL
jgi:hypothetical protein